MYEFDVFRNSGYCSHAIALVFTLENWRAEGLDEIPDEPSSTSRPQSWHVPRGSKIKPEAIAKVVVANPTSARKRRPVVSSCKKNRLESLNVVII